MKKITTISLMLAAFAMPLAHAADTTKPSTSAVKPESQPKQQNKTEQCAKEAQQQGTSDHYDYLKDCVQEKAIDARPTGTEEAQRAKLKACTADARSEPRDARKKAIDACMKKPTGANEK